MKPQHKHCFEFEASPCIFSVGSVAVSVHFLVSDVLLQGSDLDAHFLAHQEQCL